MLDMLAGTTPGAQFFNVLDGDCIPGIVSSALTRE